MATLASGQRYLHALTQSAINIAAVLVCGCVWFFLSAAGLWSNWRFGWSVLGVSPEGKLLFASAMANVAALKILLPLCCRAAWRRGYLLLALLGGMWWAAATMLSIVAWFAAFDISGQQLVGAASVFSRFIDYPERTIELWLLAYCAAALELTSVLTCKIAFRQSLQICDDRSLRKPDAPALSLEACPRASEAPRCRQIPSLGVLPLRIAQPPRERGRGSAVIKFQLNVPVRRSRPDRAIVLVQSTGEAVSQAVAGLRRFGGCWPRAPCPAEPTGCLH